MERHRPKPEKYEAELPNPLDFRGFRFVDTVRGAIATLPAARRPLLIKADIVNRVAKTADVPRVKASIAVETVLEAMKDALRQGKRIELRGFGVFLVRDRKKGVGRNPKTGVEVAIAPGKTVRFKPGKALRDL